MLETINEPIDVIVKFTQDKILPIKFLWQGREVLVKKLNLMYSNRQGRTKFYYFAVSDNANYFKLQFDSESLKWVLLEVYSE